MRISALEIDRKYPIIEAQHTVTKYGSTVLLIIKDKSNNTIKVFLTKGIVLFFFRRRCNFYQFEKVSLYLVYKGMSDKSYILAIEK